MITTNIDGFVASLFDPVTWTKAFEASTLKMGTLVDVGKFLFDALFGKKDAKTGKNATLDKQAEDFGVQVVTGISNWFTDVMPKSKVATEGVKKFWIGIGLAFQNFVDKTLTGLPAKTIADTIVQSLSEAFSVDNMGKVVTKMFTALRSAVNTAKDILKDLGGYIWARIWGAITSSAGQALGGLGWVGNELQKILGIHRAAGFHGIVTGRTPMIVGEQGAEQVDITTRADMMTQKKKGSSSGESHIIHTHVYLDGRVIADVVAKNISINQSVYK